MRILIAVLDWGLGHAARSIALAERLREEGHEIQWAAAGAAAALLKKDCYFEVLHQLPAYDVRYESRNMHLNVAWQLPKMVKTIRQERRVTEQLVRDFKVAKLISDSRFGCYSSHCESVFLTHQLRPIFGVPGANFLYQQWLSRFDEYWVPDHPDRRLSGKLSDPTGYGSVKFIGPLSRLAQFKDVTLPKTFDEVALLSGPEPQRTLLEKELLERFVSQPGNHLIIRGKPDGKPTEGKTGNCTILNYTNAEETARYLQAAKRITCRSGYSTVMDLDALDILDERVTFVPTPGQTEQGYLSDRLNKENLKFKS